MYNSVLGMSFSSSIRFHTAFFTWLLPPHKFARSNPTASARSAAVACVSMYSTTMESTCCAGVSDRAIHSKFKRKFKNDAQSKALRGRGRRTKGTTDSGMMHSRCSGVFDAISDSAGEWTWSTPWGMAIRYWKGCDPSSKAELASEDSRYTMRKKLSSVVRSIAASVNR